MKSPAEYASEWIGGRLVNGLEGLVTDYIAGLPIMIGVSIGVYVLVGMLSKTLARMGVVGVFLYGALVLIV